MKTSPPQLNDFVRLLNEAAANAEVAGRNLVALSISQPGITWLAAAIASLGWAAEPNDLVCVFVGLPVIVLPADKLRIAAIDSQNRIHPLA